MVEGSSPVAVTYTSNIKPVSNNEFFDFQATIEYEFALKGVHDMIRTYRQPFTISIPWEN